jgi:alcohol dehydrogenase class IV
MASACDPLLDMDLPTASFDFEYVPVSLAYGRGCTADLGATIDDLGGERALVVCGSNVGANRDVMDPVESALGDRLVGVFDETTPQKYVGTVCNGVERIRADEADVLVAVGSGSSLNVTRAMAEVAALDRPRDEVVDKAAETGRIPVPDAEPIPNVAVPTTMAGADLSPGGRILLTDEPMAPASFSQVQPSALLDDDRLMPETVFYDPAMFATTPTGVLTSSAMNGFDKGIETIYSRLSNPISDAHAVAGLRYLREGLPGIHDPANDEAFDLAALGTLLVQYERFTNVIHTFGNGVSQHYDVQQGDVHGIAAPPALRYVFDRIDSRRRVLAEALGINPSGMDDDAVADAVVETVTEVRDDLGLPDRLRDVDGLEREHLPDVARVIAENPKHARNPPNLVPAPEDIEGVLEAAW